MFCKETGEILGDDAHSDALSAAPIKIEGIDESELGSIAAVWSDLPPAIRRAMLAMIEAAARG